MEKGIFKMKDRIAQISLFSALILVAASYLPWFYLKPAYYVFRYVVLALLGISTALTFSFKRTTSVRFMKLFFALIVLVAVEFLFFKILHYRFHLEDLTQLIVAFLCLCLGINMKNDLKFWMNVSYFYTILLIIMGLINCYYYAKGFYVPEYYLFNKGKNQVGALIAIGAAALFFFGMKLKENRVHYWAVFFLAVEALLMIRSRASFFALIACVILIVVKDADWKWKWNVKTVLTIIALLVVSYIFFTGFIGNELHTFFSGGKNLNHNTSDVLSSNRLERDSEAVKVLSDNGLSGELSQASGIKLVHNYVILRLSRYGVWALPFLAFYIYFGIRILCGVFKTWKTEVTNVGFIVCILPFIVSLFEPSFPYGPGEIQLLVFLLLGFSFRSIHENELSRDGADSAEDQVWYQEIKELVHKRKK